MIKRFMFIVLALLFVMGVANAANIPAIIDAQNAPEVWTTEVYNNSGGALTSGIVAVWDMASDTADTSYAYRTNWVTTSSTADDINVAGVVVDPTIAAGDVGTIAIRGPVYVLCDDSSEALTADNVVGNSSTTAGHCGDSTAGTNVATLGWSIIATPVATSLGGYGGTDGNNNIMMPVFVNISLDAD